MAGFIEYSLSKLLSLSNSSTDLRVTLLIEDLPKCMVINWMQLWEDYGVPLRNQGVLTILSHGPRFAEDVTVGRRVSLAQSNCLLELLEGSHLVLGVGSGLALAHLCKLLISCGSVYFLCRGLSFRHINYIDFII